MIRSGHRRLARSFNLCYRYIDDLIVFNNKKFLDYLKEIYPSQLTVEKANVSSTYLYKVMLSFGNILKSKQLLEETLKKLLR